MFAIKVPSTVTLATPAKSDKDEPETYATLDFAHPTDDVSKCKMTLTTADGHIHEALFDTNGGVREQTFTSREEIEKRHAAEEAKLAKQRERDEKVAHEQEQRELRTDADTTAADVAWDAPHDPQPTEHNPFDPGHDVGVASNAMMPPEHNHG